MKQRINKGFTLVELLFVMAIISILATFAITHLGDSTKLAAVTAMKHDMKMIITKQYQILSKTGHFMISKGYGDSKGKIGTLWGNPATGFTPGESLVLSKDVGVWTWEYSESPRVLVVLVRHRKISPTEGFLWYKTDLSGGIPDNLVLSSTYTGVKLGSDPFPGE